MYTNSLTPTLQASLSRLSPLTTPESTHCGTGSNTRQVVRAVVLAFHRIPRVEYDCADKKKLHGGKSDGVDVSTDDGGGEERDPTDQAGTSLFPENPSSRCSTRVKLRARSYCLDVNSRDTLPRV